MWHSAVMIVAPLSSPSCRPLVRPIHLLAPLVEYTPSSSAQIVMAAAFRLWLHLSPLNGPRLSPLRLWSCIFQGKLCQHEGGAEHDRDYWASPKLTAEGDNFIHEVSRDELEFFVDGEMYERLAAWGWDCLQVEAYSYRFIPHSVGCEIVVKHLPSGQEVHLTEDVGW